MRIKPMKLQPCAPLLFLVVIRACQQKPALQAKDIAQSIRVGDEAEMPYGFALYPGARKTLSLLGGTGLGIESTATIGELSRFYRGELKRLGWRITDQSQEDTKIQLTGRRGASDAERMEISINPSTTSSNGHTLIFLNIVN
ncbi:MAG: hypothetical protein WA918_12240 [Erythrobacter sp.]